MNSVRNDIVNSVLLEPQDDLDVAVSGYDEVLQTILDKHAPLKERVVIFRPSAPWYTVEGNTEKRERRQLEPKWRTSGFASDRELYVHQCSVVNHLIKENSGDQKVLFKTVQKPTVNQKHLSEITVF